MPAAERHTWLQSVAYHLLPGLAPLALMLAVAPGMAANGSPLAMAFYLGAFLFSAYHFWSPWQVLSRILMVAPMNYAVPKQRSLWVSVFTHLKKHTDEDI